jgi:hypothetical protein
VKRVLSFAAAGGLVPPAAWFGLHAAWKHPTSLRFEHIIGVLWPSSIWLLATDGMESTATAHVVTTMAIIANVLLYSGIGAIVWWLARVMGSHKSS